MIFTTSFELRFSQFLLHAGADAFTKLSLKFELVIEIVGRSEFADETSSTKAPDSPEAVRQYPASLRQSATQTSKKTS